MDTKIRETFYVPQQFIGDFTSQSGFIIGKDKYNYITEYPAQNDFGTTEMIIQRERDGKFFKYSWCHTDGFYYYEPQWVEVFPQVVTKTVYI